MPIKDIIDGKVSGGRFVPAFLATDQPAFVALADGILAHLQASIGKAWGEICEEIRSEYQNEMRALHLLECIQDQLDFQVSPQLSSPEQWRQDVLNYAQRLRRSTQLDLATYQSEVAAHFSRASSELIHELYGDLPEFRVLSQSPSMSGHTLLLVFNRAMLQELIIDSDSLTLISKNPKELSSWLVRAPVAADVAIPAAGKKVIVARSGKLKKSEWRAIVQLLVLELPDLVNRFALSLEFSVIWKKKERQVRISPKDLLFFQ